MKAVVWIIYFFFCQMLLAQSDVNAYLPSEANHAARKELKESRYGLLIHWDPSCLLVLVVVAATLLFFEGATAPYRLIESI